jgi:hypothetical protein
VSDRLELDSMNISPQTRRRIERLAYKRAADVAKSYAEHWEAEARDKKRRRRPLLQEWAAEIKARHWRILENTIRDLTQSGAEARNDERL